MPEGKHGIQPVEYNGFAYVCGGGVDAGRSSSTTCYRAHLETLRQCGVDELE